MNILLIGSGGREHALAWKISQSEQLSKLYVAPGNAGTASVATNVNLSVNNFQEVADFVIAQEIAIVVVGPEAPLVAGITDYLKAHKDLQQIKVIGPGKQGALLEGSKDFAKQFMHKYHIPTAAAKSFTAAQQKEALNYLKNQPTRYVLKADGLAAGKGVIITSNLVEAEKNLREMFAGKFGEASQCVLIEEYMQGIELSVFVLTDANNYIILPLAKDYKRIGEGDTGLNTGGMGAVSPVPFADQMFMQKVENEIVKPTIEGLQKERIHYQGFIFIGLMNINGQPKVVEYNVRMGDPETEVVMLLLQSDLVKLLNLTAQGKLNKANIQFDSRTAATVMLVSGGYPEAYEKGKVISGLDTVEDVILFHASTNTNEVGEIITNGGRVLAVSAYGTNQKEALEKAYKAAENIQFDKKYFRRDIGFDLYDLK